MPILGQLRDGDLSLHMRFLPETRHRFERHNSRDLRARLSVPESAYLDSTNFEAACISGHPPNNLPAFCP